MANRSHTLQVRFDPEELAILDSVAATWKESRAGAIRRMALEQLQRNELKAAKLRRLASDPKPSRPKKSDKSDG